MTPRFPCDVRKGVVELTLSCYNAPGREKAMSSGIGPSRGKLILCAALLFVVAWCLWRFWRVARGPRLTIVPTMVVCDKCGSVNPCAKVPLTRGGVMQLPVACGKCGAKEAFIAVYCPKCGKALALRVTPPRECKYCGASLAGMFPTSSGPGGERP